MNIHTASLVADRIDVSTHRPAVRAAGVLALYALGFALTHGAASAWGGAGYYSLWFPAAGLRLALLWRMGAVWTLPLCAIELAVDFATGAVPMTGPDALIGWLGVVRPVLAYGGTVWLVRRLMDKDRNRGIAALAAPMPFAVASVAAPLIAALFTVPQAMLRGDLTGVVTAREIGLSIAAFTVGDVLGTLLVAPPVLWLADRLSGRAHGPLPRPRPGPVAESIAALVLGAVAGETLGWLGLGSQSAPSLIAVAWIGLRFGRVPAWFALLAVCAMLLPQTAGAMDTPARLQFHLGLASVVVAGYLAGSFHDAQRRARADLARRDRLLFQADRLRRYGGRAVDEPSALPLANLIESVGALAASEVKAARARLVVTAPDPALAVMAQEVELAQAVVNLIRNAVQACGPDGEIALSANAEAGKAIILVTNRCAANAPAHAGMGVGTLVARAIVEAHGGRLTIVRDGADVRAVVTLPLIGAEA